MKLKINEIFYSIQGESTWSGLPCVFVRLTGCNLRCSYCDTEYSYFEGEEYLFDEILNMIKKFDCKHVLLTGGEPLYQENCNNFINFLIDNGYKVFLETNGTIPIKDTNPECIKIMDIKCPDSGITDTAYIDNIMYLGKDDEIKFVISSENDFIFAKRIIENNLGDFDHKKIILSAVKEKIELQRLAELLLGSKLNVRLQIQIHKFIWPDIERGV